MEEKEEMIEAPAEEEIKLPEEEFKIPEAEIIEEEEFKIPLSEEEEEAVAKARAELEEEIAVEESKMEALLALEEEAVGTEGAEEEVKAEALTPAEEITEPEEEIKLPEEEIELPDEEAVEEEEPVAVEEKEEFEEPEEELRFLEEAVEEKEEMIEEPAEEGFKIPEMDEAGIEEEFKLPEIEKIGEEEFRLPISEEEEEPVAVAKFDVEDEEIPLLYPTTLEEFRRQLEGEQRKIEEEERKKLKALEEEETKLPGEEEEEIKLPDEAVEEEELVAEAKPELPEEIAIEESRVEALLALKDEMPEEIAGAEEREEVVFEELEKRKLEEIDPEGELTPSEFLGRILELFLSLVSVGRAKIETPKNIVRMKHLLSDHYSHLHRTLREKGFSLGEFEEEIPEEDVEATIKDFVQALTKSYLLFLGTERLREEYPQYFIEIEKLEEAFKDLSRIEEARELVVDKRRDFERAPPAPAALFLARMIEDFEHMLVEEKSKPATSENIIRIQRKLNDFYTHARHALEKKGFSLGEFREDVPEEEFDETIRRFVQTLTKSYLVFLGCEHLKEEYPQQLEEIEELEESLKDLSRVEEARELIIKKRAELKMPSRGEDAQFIRKIIQNLSTTLIEERTKPGTLENIIKRNERLKTVYLENLDELREAGFSTEGVEELSERDTEKGFEEFIATLRELSVLCEELDQLWDEHPRYVSEIEDLETILKDLSRGDEGKILLTEKRTVFKLRTLIEDYGKVTREFEMAKDEIREMEEVIAEKDLELFLAELEEFKKKYFTKPSEERELRLSEFAARLEEHGLIESKTALEKLQNLNLHLFEKQAELLEQDLDALSIINSAMESKEATIRGSEDYRNIEKHKNDTSFLFVTLKRFVEMELNARAKILGK